MKGIQDLGSSYRNLGSLLVMTVFPQVLNYVVGVALDKEVSWIKYWHQGEIFTSLCVIIGFILVQISLLHIVPAEWTPEFPHYKLNGLPNFFISVLLTLFCWPFLPWIYSHFDDLILTTEWLGLLTCALIFFKSKIFPTPLSFFLELPNESIYNFYSGLERHPTILSFLPSSILFPSFLQNLRKIQIKQITNCRFGMLAWPLISICCLAYQYSTFHFVANSILISTVLQLLYCTKFFWWEQGYFNTLDMAYDHTGFYIIWGVMCWVPGFYTLSSIWLANRPIVLNDYQAWLYLALGITSIYVNYEVDYQKMIARKHPDNKIWGKKIEMLEMYYGHTDLNGNTEKKSSVFCMSGWWGVSRHFHYIPEVLACLSWALPCGFNWSEVTKLETWLPFAYAIYLSGLLVHRIYRDEEKCEAKYGAYYEEYKKRVPYRLVPYIY